MHLSELPARSVSRFDETSWPIQICLLGSFRLLKAGHQVAIQAGGKAEALLCHLGLQVGHQLPRAALVQRLWPASDGVQANHSLNSLIYSLHKLIGAGPGGAAPVLHTEGYYRLNPEAGVGVDVTSSTTSAYGWRTSTAAAQPTSSTWTATAYACTSTSPAIAGAQRRF